MAIFVARVRVRHDLHIAGGCRLGELTRGRDGLAGAHVHHALNLQRPRCFQHVQRSDHHRLRRRQRAVVRRACQEARRVQDSAHAVIRHSPKNLRCVGDVAFHEPDLVFHVVKEFGLDRNVEGDDVLALFERIAHRERPAETTSSRNQYCHSCLLRMPRVRSQRSWAANRV